MPIFVDNADRRSFLGALSHSGELTGWSLLSYCLMSNHAHLLVRVGAGGLSVGMHSLTTRHAHRFNATHGTSGHLFERRFHTSVIRHDAHLLESFRYIALNPWRAGVTDDRDIWRWSAHRALAGLCPAPRMLDRQLALEYFDGDADVYRSFVADGERSPKRPPLAVLAREGEAGLAAAHFDHGYSQAEIAAAFGLSQATVCRRLRSM